MLSHVLEALLLGSSGVRDDLIYRLRESFLPCEVISRDFEPYVAAVG